MPEPIARVGQRVRLTGCPSGLRLPSLCGVVVGRDVRYADHWFVHLDGPAVDADTHAFVWVVTEHAENLEADA